MRSFSILAHGMVGSFLLGLNREINFIRHEDWRSSSPDLSLLDSKIWQHLEENSCSKPHPNSESLKTSFIKAAADIDMDLVRAAIDDWPRRLKACIQNHGDAAGDQGGEIYSFIQVTAVEKRSIVMSAIFFTSRGVLFKAQNSAKINISSRETFFHHGSHMFVDL
ncbi:hypothetical protein evm_010518 [Chilo suppressalis]|nr:hypothetical protein evm_010518 [Chilo suppressalis]